MKIADIKPAPYNPRKITDRQMQMLAKAMSEFGDLSGFVLNTKTGNLVGGHQRLKNIPENAIIEKQKLKKISKTGTVAEGYIIADGERWSYREVEWDLNKEKMANIAANKHGGSFDDEKLSLLLSEINSMADVDFDLTGFESYELDKLVESLKEEEEEDSIIPEINNDNVKTKTGDLFLLENHRLLCGDSTKKDDIVKLMDGKKANMIFTDPPYGTNYLGGRSQVVKHKNYGKIQNDANSNIDIFLEAIISTQCIGDIYICLSPINLKPLFRVIDNYDGIIIWKKPSPGLGYQHIRRYCEFIIFIAGKKVNKRSRCEFDFWEIPTDNRQNYEHGTQKPIYLPMRAIKYSTQIGDIVLDLFSGSGSSFVAAERTKRNCYGMEIDPKYCDVIIARWEKYTEKKAIKC